VSVGSAFGVAVMIVTVTVTVLVMCCCTVMFNIACRRKKRKPHPI